MLHDFYQQENSRKPGSVHATYLLLGTRQPLSANGDSQRATEDAALPSSSAPRSPVVKQESVQTGVMTISMTLVKEEDLERTFWVSCIRCSVD